MKVIQAIKALQDLLCIPPEQQAARVGPLTRAKFEQLAGLASSGEWPVDVKTMVVAYDSAQPSRLITTKGANFIKSFEGLVLEAADDGGGVPTVGWGHTGLQHNDGTVFIGRVITLAKAQQLFDYDMQQFEAAVSSLVTVPLNNDQFDALVSFDFNTGGLKGSHLLQYLNEKRYADAADQLLKWDHDGGRQIAGLTRRRRSERRLFNSLPHYLLEDNAEVLQDDAGHVWPADPPTGAAS